MLLLGSDDFVANAYEFLVGTTRADGKGDYVSNNSQVFLPLSASSSGSLQLAFRVNNSDPPFYVKIVGFTR